MLTVSGLRKRYDEHSVVGPVSFEVPDGATLALLGPNGSGKSTLIHAITDLISADAGEVTIAGFACDSLAAKRVLGFIPDELPLPHSLTGRNYLDFILKVQPAASPSRAQILKEAVGLLDADEKFISEYSHGMKKKLQFVAAMVHSPEVLILDEPFRGLDPEARSLIETLIQEHCRAGGTALIATHDLRWAQHHVDGVVVMSGGVQVAEGSVAGLLHHYDAADLEQVFLSASGSRASYAARLDQIKSLF